MGFDFLFVIFYHCCFSDHYFSSMLDQSPTTVKTPDKDSHLVLGSSFSFMVWIFILPLNNIYTERCWIIFPSFKTKGKGVLSSRYKLTTKIIKNRLKLSNDSSSRIPVDLIHLSSLSHIVVFHGLLFPFI